MKRTMAWFGRLVQVGSAVCLLSFSQVSADVVVLQNHPSELLRYNQSTGAFLGASQSEMPSEDFAGMAIGADGNLYVVDNTLGDGTVMRFDGATGAYLGVFIDSPNSGGMKSPRGIAFGPDGRLYVGCVNTNQESQVLRYDEKSGAFVDAFVAPGSGGLTRLSDLAFGRDGDLYVIGSGQAVLRYNGADGHLVSEFALCPSNASPRNLAFGPSGDLFVTTTADNVLRFDGQSGALIGTFVASGDGGLLNPAGLAFADDGSLYVSSRDSHAILHYNGSTGAFIDSIPVRITAPNSSGPTFLAVTKPVLHMEKDGGSVILKWAGSYQLQSASSMVGPFTDVAGSYSPCTNTIPAGENRFFRLRPIN
jgi:outer membrane protein assembly factor BamB